jgi:twinkle protein
MALKSNLPCPNPLCSSSDGYAEFEDGGFCFVCRKKFRLEGGNTVEDSRYSQQYLPWRGISRETFEFFGAKTYVEADGKPYALQIPYGPNGHNLRYYEPNGNKYKFEGNAASTQLAGQDKFPAGSAKAITLYEGGLDAYSGFQMLGSKYPSVGVKSSSSAYKECSLQHEYLNSFEQIYICFDSDAPGLKAAREVAKLFDFNKVFHIKMPTKDGKHVDVNDMLQAGKYKDFNNLWWNAKRLVPEGIVSTHAEVWDIISTRQGEALCKYPWPTLQDMAYGLFGGQFIVIKAPTKIGKTEFISHIEYEVLKNTDFNIGVIHIEDRKDITPKRYATYELGKTCHLPDSFVTNEEIYAAYQKAVRRDNRVHYYSHFGSKDPDVILDTIRFLVTVCGCKFIFLDHITLVISGLADDDERRALDRIATSLATMTNDLNFCCVAISHVNDNGQSRGSRTIEHTAHTIISLSRNKAAEDEKERNTTLVSLEGNRLSGLTGPAGKLIFNRETWRMTEDNGDEAQRLLS